MAMEKNVEKSNFITYQSLENGEVKTVELVSEWEVDHNQDKISSDSPLGSVLASKKIGEVGEFKTKQKSCKIKVLNIKVKEK